MLKKYIYLIIIALMFFSCSKPTLLGDWKLSKETIFKNIEEFADMNQYYDAELRHKLASKLSENTTYSFLDNGSLNIKTLSLEDSTIYNFSASWKNLDENVLEISKTGNDIEKYKFIFDEDLLILENLSDSTKTLILERK
tara:strand:+ start:56 stop:475 length:420 start_codon:yes stop_codon:yes gene_type:complete